MNKIGLFLCAVLLTAGGYGGEPGDVIIRRQAFRRDIEKHPENLEKYLASPDAEIRRYALYLTVKKQGEAAKEICKASFKDPDEQVRLTALEALRLYARNDADVQALLAEVAASDTSRKVAKRAAESVWPFHRNVTLLRNDPNWDHEVKTLKKIRIPDDRWKIKLDPRGIGHLPKQKWYQEKMNESGWTSIRQGAWEKQGYDYDGIAWYRIRFDMPKKMDCNAVELNFKGVDETAWVWLNGTYLGCHDIGTIGWKIPFSLDCTKEIHWGRENMLAVRVLDTEQDGGIYKPIHIEILK